MQIEFSDIDRIRSAGFSGFKSVAELKDTRLQDVPSEPGVYLALAPPGYQPEFLTNSVGGHFEEKDPTFPVSKLKTNWVAGATVLYIGKAGGTGVQQTLRKRLSQYLRFGDGKPVAHRGGRLIWQLSNSEDLLICWKPITDNEPRNIEKAMIQSFYEQYGKRPFANLTG